MVETRRWRQDRQLHSDSMTILRSRSETALHLCIAYTRPLRDRGCSLVGSEVSYLEATQVDGSFSRIPIRCEVKRVVLERGESLGMPIVHILGSNY